SRRLSERALTGAWPRFPVSPQAPYEAFAGVVNLDWHHGQWATMAVTEVLAEATGAQVREAVGAARLLAVRRAALACGLRALRVCDDSCGTLGEWLRRAVAEYAAVPWRRTAMPADVFWQDFLEFLVEVGDFGVVGQPWLRRGLCMVTVGAVAGLGYCLPKVISLIWGKLGISPLGFVNSLVAPTFASVSAALFAVGFTMPAWGVGLGRAMAWMSDYRTFHRHYPLWQAITRAFPEVVLVAPPASRRELAPDLRFFLGRQVIEILDGDMRLRPHHDPEISRMTREVAANQNITGDEADAVAEAAQIAAALQARSTGHEASGGHGTDIDDAANGDLNKEGARLTRVADAFSTSTVIPAVLERLRSAKTDA
ncbi:MAB_1171c family putative transporter, partial [Streptomyces sp. NPDC001393]